MVNAIGINPAMDLRQYLVVTGSYWAFTITDGALRMLVVLYFYQLGYSPLEVATLFLLYEFFGVVTNLVGGWLGAHLGLNKTMHLGMGLQIVALAMLTVDDSLLSVAYVMAAQALSGIAKDLNKMSAKSSVKLLLPDNAQGNLYKWVTLLTGSKNALKGAGFFIGAALLAVMGFQGALGVLAAVLAAVFGLSLVLLRRDLGRSSFKPKFRDLFSKSESVNHLSAARMFLFCARDVWFVVALPVYLQSVLHWSHTEVGAFLAVWVIGYGIVQSLAPSITGIKSGRVPDGVTTFNLALLLAILPLLMVGCLLVKLSPDWVIVIGLMAFGVVFAINSAVHSYLIIAYAKADGVSLDVGFYYMANAAGRLSGTVLSGLIYQYWGISACLLMSALFLFLTSGLSLRLPRHTTHPT